MEQETWPKCGHPKTIENSGRIGRDPYTGEQRYACLECRRAIGRKSWRKRYYNEKASQYGN